MNTFIFTINEKNDIGLHDYNICKSRLHSGLDAFWIWSCASKRKMKAGDTALIIQSGSKENFKRVALGNIVTDRIMNGESKMTALIEVRKTTTIHDQRIRNLCAEYNISYTKLFPQAAGTLCSDENIELLISEIRGL